MRNKRLIIIFSIVCALTLLIVINSVFFTVQKVIPYCLNSDDTTYDDAVAGADGINFGSSIFFIDEQEVVDAIQSDLESQGIVNIAINNIERQFPNTILVHYIIIEPYYYVVSDNYTYFFSQSGVLLEIDEKECDKQGKLQVLLGGDLVGKSVGDTIESTDADDAQQLEVILDAISRLIAEDEFSSTFDFIDILDDEYYIKMSQGAYIYINSSESFFERLQLGISSYKACISSADASSVEQSKTGTFQMTLVDGVPLAAWTSENSYETR